MKAAVGDHIVVASSRIGSVRDGVIVELRNQDGSPPYVVQWFDSGRRAVVFPGQDARLVAHQDPSEQAYTTSARVKTWHITIDVFEEGDETKAHAVLSADAPTHLDGRGMAWVRPGERNIPEIGDEVAVGRALHRLADRLLATAEADLEDANVHPAVTPD
jgi:Domain of unknown function (DUF1876)/Domain of unknown function (DUF1918)